MKIIKINHQTENIPQSVIALGFFDGVHLAHQTVIKSAIKLAGFLNIKSQVFTFRAHPKSAIDSGGSPLLLSDFSEKVELIKKMGVEFLTFLDFDKNFSRLSQERFVKDILVEKLHARIVVAGFDYRFGFKAKGDISFLNKLGKQYGFKVKVVPPVWHDNIPISSTLIRELISSGKIAQANILLGHFFKSKGKVKKGKGFGKILGVRTANLPWPAEKVKLGSGIYAVFVRYKTRIYSGAANLGFSPTFGLKRKSLGLEVHIFNFKGNLYKKELEVYFVNKIRDEKKFETPKLLFLQIKKDIIKAKKILRRNGVRYE